MKFHILKICKIVIEKERKYIQKEKNSIHFTIVHIFIAAEVAKCRLFYALFNISISV